VERIKQALDKARQEQTTDTQRNQRPDVGVAGPVDDAAIRYTQTRIVTIDPAVLVRNRIIMGAENPEAGRAYRMLRTRVLQRLNSNGWNTFAITSPGPEQGKTLTAINLAINLAREVSYTVLLVDFDMQAPGIHRYFGLESGPGITDYFYKSTPLSDILVNTGIRGLVLLPGFETVPDSSEILKSPKMLKLVDELKNRYSTRIVIFDLPPLLARDDALAFAPYVDAVLLVIEEGNTNVKSVEQSIEMLKGIEILGTVLNKSRDTMPAD